MRTFHVVLSIMLLAVAAAPARADGFVTPFYGFNFGGDSNCETFTNCEDKRKNFGVSIGMMGTVFGFEEDISIAKDFFGKVPNVDNSVFTLMSNLLIGVGVGPVQPYFLVGAGSDSAARLVRSDEIRHQEQLARLRPRRRRERLLQPACGHPRRRAALSRAAGSGLPVFGEIAGQIFVTQKLDFWRASVGLSLRF